MKYLEATTNKKNNLFGTLIKSSTGALMLTGIFAPAVQAQPLPKSPLTMAYALSCMIKATQTLKGASESEVVVHGKPQYDYVEEHVAVNSIFKAHVITPNGPGFTSCKGLITRNVMAGQLVVMSNGLNLDTPLQHTPDGLQIESVYNGLGEVSVEKLENRTLPLSKVCRAGSMPVRQLVQIKSTVVGHPSVTTMKTYIGPLVHMSC